MLDSDHAPFVADFLEAVASAPAETKRMTSLALFAFVIATFSHFRVHKLTQQMVQVEKRLAELESTKFPENLP